MKVAVIVARLLFGGVFLVFGLNHFLGFLGEPEPAAGTAEFWKALGGSGYFMPLLKWTEVVCGAAIVVGVFVPLALVVIAPVVVQIAAYHVFLDDSGLPIAGALVALQLFLFYAYKRHYVGLLNPFAHPTVTKRIAT